MVSLSQDHALKRHMPDAIILFLIVYAIHLAPAFTPPTLPVVVLFALQGQIPAEAIVVAAAGGAALGRLTLALLFRLFAHRLPARLRSNLEAARAAVNRKAASRWTVPALFLFGASSAPLFEAAGLTRLRLLPLAGLYFVGRLPRYWLYVIGAEQLGTTDFWQSFRETLTSPVGIAVQLLMIALLAALIRTDWSRWLKR